MCSLTGNEGWLEDSRFADEEHRRRNADDLDDAIERLDPAAGQDKRTMEILQAAGVPAQAVFDDVDLYRDPHLAARGFFQKMNHAVAGVHRYPGFLWDLTAVKQAAPLPPNTLGSAQRLRVWGDCWGCSARGD